MGAVWVSKGFTAEALMSHGNGHTGWSSEVKQFLILYQEDEMGSLERMLCSEREWAQGPGKHLIFSCLRSMGLASPIQDQSPL